MLQAQKRKWIGSGIFLALFLLIAANLSRIAPVDTFTYLHVSRLHSSFFSLFFRIITQLASPAVMLLLCFVMVFTMQDKRYRIPLMLNIVLSALLNLALKDVFQRARPSDVLTLVQESGYSFPSGHSMAATTFYGFLIFLLPRSGLSPARKKFFTYLLALCIPLVMLSRIYLGVHYFSDILGGFLIAMVYLAVYTTLVEEYVKHPENEALTSFNEKKAPLFSSFSYAAEGIRAAFLQERNMVIHFAAMTTVTMLGLLLKLSKGEWIACLLLFGMVLMGELMNTAIETVVDIAMPDKDPRAKLAKDTAAGGVLIAAVIAAIIGAIIFLPKIWTLLQTL